MKSLFRGSLFAVLIGLIGAALLHIVIILTLPQLTGKDAYTRVLGLFEMDRFFPLDAKPGFTGLANGDPFLQVAVCSFSISELATRLQAVGKVPFWSLAIYDSASNEVFSMNDETSVTGTLDVVIASNAQLITLRKSLPAALTNSILVEMPDTEGYAVLRAFAPVPSLLPAAKDFITQSACEEFDPALQP